MVRFILEFQVVPEFPSKFQNYKFKNTKKKMDKFKGGIKAKKKAPVKIKRQEVDEITNNEYSQERFLSEVAKKLVGFNVDLETLSRVLKNLQIGDSKELSDDDLFLIYNLLTEPLLSNEDKGNEHNKGEIESMGTVSRYSMYSRLSETDKVPYSDKLLDVSYKFMDVLPNQRVNGIYHNLPSLGLNRMNFEIEKDIFRNKPLLGKGIFKCEKCGSDDTEDYEKQTRSADEPMTVFVNCRKCKARFRYG
jgi:DNA-directed RNA polymerase subunit M/transcription elongation factor TFIIS